MILLDGLLPARLVLSLATTTPAETALIWAAAITSFGSIIVALIAAIFGYLGKRETIKTGAKLSGDHDHVTHLLGGVCEDLGVLKKDLEALKLQLDEHLRVTQLRDLETQRKKNGE